MRRRLGSAALVLVAALGASACAPVLAGAPRLVAAWPAPEAHVAGSPHVLELTFNRDLRVDSTRVEVSRAADERWLETELESQSPNALRVHVTDRQDPATYRVRWHAVAARGGTVADGEYDFEVLPGPGPSPRVVVSTTTSDSSAENGEIIQVNGRGFTPHQPIELRIGDDDEPLTSVEADQRGRFSADTRLPQFVAFGVQPVSASDALGERATAAVRVHWGGWPPLVAWTEGEPGPEPGQVTFALAVRNRSDYLLEHVHVTVADPPGAVFVASDADAQHVGNELTWELTTLDRGIGGPLHVWYRAVAPVVTHARIEFRHRRPHGCAGDECLSAFVSETTSESTPVAPR